MLSLARGFRATLVSSGSADNALITHAGATSEMTSGVSLDSVRIIQDAPGIARGADGPLLTAEAVLMGPIPLRSTGTGANVEVRGVSPNVLAIRSNVSTVPSSAAAAKAPFWKSAYMGCASTRYAPIFELSTPLVWAEPFRFAVYTPHDALRQCIKIPYNLRSGEEN